jgi:hypothetical protein
MGESWRNREKKKSKNRKMINENVGREARIDKKERGR